MRKEILHFWWRLCSSLGLLLADGPHPHQQKHQQAKQQADVASARTIETQDLPIMTGTLSLVLGHLKFEIPLSSPRPPGVAKWKSNSDPCARMGWQVGHRSAAGPSAYVLRKRNGATEFRAQKLHVVRGRLLAAWLPSPSLTSCDVISHCLSFRRCRSPLGIRRDGSRPKGQAT